MDTAITRKHGSRPFNKNFAEIVTDAGATVLENEYMDITVQDNELRIAGYMGYYRAVNMTADTEKEQQAELAFMDEFENTDRYKILLNHIPTSWSDWGYLICILSILFLAATITAGRWCFLLWGHYMHLTSVSSRIM